MPLSRYIKLYPSPSHPDSFFVYSTIKGSIIKVPASVIDAAQTDSLSDENRSTLENLAIYVDDLEAERERMQGIVARTNGRSSKFRGTIVLNLDCNLNCSYCFEKDFREGYYMTGESAELLVEWVTRNHLKQGRDVEIKFYGGEPLLSLPLLKRIASSLGAAAAAEGRKFKFGMVTNGTMLTRPLVEELLPLGFSWAQLTLDGPREVHDRLRPFASGAGSYDTIVGNIRQIYELVTLKLGGNYHQENYREYPKVLDDLLSVGVSPEKLDPIMFAPILPKSGPNTSIELTGHCSSSNEPWLNEAALFLREEILKRGFSAMKTVLGSCMVELEHDLIINYDGSFYKCPSFMGWPELCVGSLTDGIKNYSESHKVGIWKNDTCMECEYLPICFGGCRLLPLLRNGVIDEVDCRKPFYDATLEQMILQDLRYR